MMKTTLFGLALVLTANTVTAQQIVPISTHGTPPTQVSPGVYSQHAVPTQVIHHTQGQPIIQTHGGAFACDHCGYSATNPPAQPQVAIGRCPSCNVAVDCADNCGRVQTPRDLHPYNFQPLGHGEWMGPIRVPSTNNTRLRVGDTLRFIFLQSQIKSPNFRLQIGDQVQISSIQDEELLLGDLVQGQGVEILPDGTLTVRMLGKVPAAGLTIEQLREQLEKRYKKYVKDPAIDVIAIKTNSLLQSIIDSVDARAGSGGQTYTDTVDSDGAVRLPKLGAICVLGLTVQQAKREINLRYQEIVSGLEVEPTIEQEAPHFVYVTGAVATPGQFELVGPTTVTQALALAGGVVNARGNRRKIAIFRRAEDWRTIATLVDLAGMHYGHSLTTTDDIEVRDSDLIIVPLKPVARFGDLVENVFTRGIYGVLPFAQIGEGFNANGFVN
ncbi:MAG: polysaccharide biosynthesis/export family protein [Aureliella sp.]